MKIAPATAKRIVAMSLVIATMFVGTSALADTQRTPTPTKSLRVPTVTSTATRVSLTPTQAVATVTPTATEERPTATPTPAAAEALTEAASPESPFEITVYNDNLALVKEIRTLDLDQGTNEVRFDVPSGIDATSVHFQSLTAPDGTTVLEQTYEYDVVGSAKLLNMYIDREITLITEQGDIYKGTLLSASDDIILATEEGLKVVRTDKVREFSFPTLPEGLITRPTLVWLLETAAAGRQDVRVTYLTSGLSWQADYVAILAPDDQSVALTGWVTLANQSGASYQDARLKLVAGNLNRVSLDQVKVHAPTEAVAAAPQVVERSFFEYHLYQVQRPVTIRDQQTKQIEFINAPKVKAEKAFVLPGGGWVYSDSVYTDPSFPGAGATTKAQVQLRFVNDDQSGLGIALPGGRVRAYKADADGGAEFVGEDAIDHTPRDEKVSLYLGDAFDVVGERTQIKFTQVDKREAEETIQVKVRNSKADDVQVHVLENLYRAPDARVIEASAEYTSLDARTIEFVLNVPAGGEAEVTYTVNYRW